MPPKKSTGKSKTLSKRKPTVSGSKRADTLFPVGRLNRMIKKGRFSERVSSSAGAFMAAVLEYITGEYLEAAV
jgi:histone H2A